jgi:beta-galactosidase
MVNGKIVGDHKGPYNTFTFEVTDYLRIGTVNSVSVICNNEQTFDIAPTSGDFNVYGGLYRDAWMIVTDEACITPLYFGSSGVMIYQPVVNEKRAEVRAEIRLSTITDYNGCEIYFAIEDAQAKS